MKKIVGERKHRAFHKFRFAIGSEIIFELRRQSQQYWYTLLSCVVIVVLCRDEGGFRRYKKSRRSVGAILKLRGCLVVMLASHLMPEDNVT